MNRAFLVSIAVVASCSSTQRPNQAQQQCDPEAGGESSPQASYRVPVSDGHGGRFESLFDACEIQVFEPRRGGCFIRGALSGPAAIADFTDGIRFGEHKEICGRQITCSCQPPAAESSAHNLPAASPGVPVQRHCWGRIENIDGGCTLHLYETTEWDEGEEHVVSQGGGRPKLSCGESRETCAGSFTCECSK
jgi:hypothetical protein